MASASRVKFHLERERQCRRMAENAADHAIEILHRQLADRHAAMAAMEMNRDQPAEGNAAITVEAASERQSRLASSQNPLARLH
jgi:hypothetical protein